MIDLLDDAERDAAASEYVLGTLDDADQRAFEAALATDRGLQALVYAWQDRLLPLSARAAALEPARTLWQRIEESVVAAGRARSSAASEGPAAPARATAAGVAPAPRGAPWWQRLGLWQGLAGAAVAATLVLAVLVLQRPLAPPADAARYLAVLQSPDNRATGWIVELRAGGTMRLVPVGDAPPPPPGRALQFWTKAQSATAPTSLGLVQAGQTYELPVARLPAVEAEQLFEITLEPAGGSTIGRPTGPILFLGRTVRL